MYGDIKMKLQITDYKLQIAYLLLILLSIFFVDVPLAKWINGSAGDNITNIANIFTLFGSFGCIVLINIILIIFFYIKKNKDKVRLLSLSIVAQALSAGIVVRLLKYFFGRTRPYYNSEGVFLFFKTGHDFVSFPSGHSAGIWGFIICMLIVFKNNKYAKLLIILGIIVSITRLILNVHFLSDVLAGGIISGFLCYYLMMSFIKK
jgi:membrane-associated phospholipid phosphatase